MVPDGRLLWGGSGWGIINPVSALGIRGEAQKPGFRVKVMLISLVNASDGSKTRFRFLQGCNAAETIETKKKYEWDEWANAANLLGAFLLVTSALRGNVFLGAPRRPLPWSSRRP
jgi:hypothetical protein